MIYMYRNYTESNTVVHMACIDTETKGFQAWN